MEFLKKYWWAVLLAPVVIFFFYKYYQARQRTHEGAARAREAKATKAIIREMENGTIDKDLTLENTPEN